jgi:biopolymer transport protein ExbD
VAQEGLQEILRPLLAKSPSQQVVIACADLVSHGAFVDVLDQTKLSGASQIAVRER